MFVIKKLRKLILHPNRYFYDYFRKKLGFRKFFVTEKIRLLDQDNRQKWQKVLFTHPYLYLYYKFNKRLRNPVYPILVDYRIENIEKSGMGGGNRLVLAVELEKQNTIYFADPAIVQKALDKKEPYLAGKIFKFNFQGNGNRVLIDSGIKFGRTFMVNLDGDNNKAIFGADSKMLGGLFNIKGSSNFINLENTCTVNANAQIIMNGDDNTVDAKDGVSFMQGSRIVFIKNNNFAYLGPNTKISPSSNIQFGGYNDLLYICGESSLNASELILRSNTIFFYGYGSSAAKYFRAWTEETKNILIGSDCMFSYYITLRNATGHAIYDEETKERIARAKSIIIGDHVWIGYGTLILKGINIGSGSMIGGDSLISKDMPGKCIIAGHPAKVIRQKVLWTRSGPNNVPNKEHLAKFETYVEPISNPNLIGWERLLQIDSIDPFISSKEKIQIIRNIIHNA